MSRLLNFNVHKHYVSQVYKIISYNTLFLHQTTSTFTYSVVRHMFIKLRLKIHKNYQHSIMS